MKYEPPHVAQVSPFVERDLIAVFMQCSRLDKQLIGL